MQRVFSEWFICNWGLFKLPALLLSMVVLLPGIVRAGEYHLYHDLFSVSFPTEQDGWACGRWGSVIHTADGGQSWESQETGVDFTLASVCFVNPKKGWAVGDGGTIIHTGDGGESWKRQKPPAVAVEAAKRWGYDQNQEEKTEASPLTSFFMGVHFANPKQGWIVTERTTILYTEDGGKSWRIQFQDEDFILKSVSFCDDLNGWAAGEFGYIYHTENGGETWEHQAGFFDISDETGEMVGGNFLFDVFAVNPQTAWVAGIDGYVAKTVDGGASWQEVKQGIPTSHFFGITSDGSERVFIGGNAVLLTSVDGGERFQGANVEPPITYGWIYEIAPRGRAGFVFVGKGGWVYLTDRDAATWQKVVY